jgi:hypothetical protein
MMALALGGSAAVAAAQGVAGGGEDEPRWMIFVGGFFPDVDSKLQVFDPQFGLSPVLDFEDLGLESDATALRLGAAVNLSRNGRHMLEVEYIRIDRDGNLLLEEELEFGGEIFPIGVEVDGEVNTEDLDIHYIYNVLMSDRGALGLAIGVHALRVEAVARGQVRVGGGGGGQQFELQTERYADEFPLPLVGLRGRYELVPDLLLTAGFKWLSANIDDFDGEFTDSWLRLEYQLLEPLAIGVGLARIDVDYERELDVNERDIVEASYDYSGAEAFVRFRF